MKQSIIVIIMLASLSLLGCKKFLDAKSDIKLNTVDNLEKMQALLDNTNLNSNNPVAAEESADDYYVLQAQFDILDEFSRGRYIWGADAFDDKNFNDWSTLYDNVYIGNTVLNELSKLEKTQANRTTFDNVKGQAQFVRGWNFLRAMEIWSKGYNENTAGSDLGIALRLTPDFNIKSVRSSVKDSYNQILKDLSESASLLPLTSLQVTRPSRPAAFAAIAKAYLNMGKFDMANLYADSCLLLKSNLLDYNNLNANNVYPIPRYNSEVLYSTTISTSLNLNPAVSRVIDDLYASYSDNDLRKTIFFEVNSDGSYSFKGSYDESAQPFSGLGLDEVLLIKAESLARLGKFTESMDMLNNLLKMRWKNTTPYVSQTATSANDAISKILIERRKELLFRGIRWADIKRLNVLGANISLQRIFKGQTYSLPANDNRFALPIPSNVIELSGMPQNPR